MERTLSSSVDECGERSGDTGGVDELVDRGGSSVGRAMLGADWSLPVCPASSRRTGCGDEHDHAALVAVVKLPPPEPVRSRNTCSASSRMSGVERSTDGALRSAMDKMEATFTSRGGDLGELHESALSKPTEAEVDFSDGTSSVVVAVIFPYSAKGFPTLADSLWQLNRGVNHLEREDPVSTAVSRMALKLGLCRIPSPYCKITKSITDCRPTYSCTKKT